MMDSKNFTLVKEGMHCIGWYKVFKISDDFSLEFTHLEPNRQTNPDRVWRAIVDKNGELKNEMTKHLASSRFLTGKVNLKVEWYEKKEFVVLLVKESNMFLVCEARYQIICDQLQ
jgi:hypothetical protein